MKEDEDSFEQLAMGTIGDGICLMGPMGSENMVGFMVLPRSWKILEDPWSWYDSWADPSSSITSHGNSLHRKKLWMSTCNIYVIID